jgi:hypothetical protein
MSNHEEINIVKYELSFMNFHIVHRLRFTDDISTTQDNYNDRERPRELVATFVCKDENRAMWKISNIREKEGDTFIPFVSFRGCTMDTEMVFPDDLSRKLVTHGILGPLRGVWKDIATNIECQKWLSYNTNLVDGFVGLGRKRARNE